eukprot:TRINITY_DN9583_c0_g1_i1.p1 TRINITY_DN9583_c0_g1~~TRINITY_DN9583_c0_g1_i1.p1  ORF type:complete len:433 (+),score=22.65 TRINITY_DN9583_c0_g1_i1:153-1451(+)
MPVFSGAMVTVGQRWRPIVALRRRAPRLCRVAGGASRGSSRLTQSSKCRSIFDSTAFKEVESLRSEKQQRALWNHLFQHSELYARIMAVDSAASSAWTCGPRGPGTAALSKSEHASDLKILSQLVRTECDANGGAKLLLEFPDRRRVEVAIIVAPRRRSSVASTICLSSQAGCAMACRFCDTGLLGVEQADSRGRMLGLPAWAILEQVLHAEAYLQREKSVSTPSHIVFMGMGEPLLNYSEVLAVSHALCGSDDVSRKRRVTLSTVGVAPRIVTLGRDAPRELQLALSLHAPTQDLRVQLMPVAAKSWPLSSLMESVRTYEASTDMGVLLEYILIDGVNDQDHHAEALAQLIASEQLRCSGVNLIPYNPTTAGAIAGYKPPSDSRCKAFRARLREAGSSHRSGQGLNVTVRFSTKLGRGTSSACGQLGLQYV